MCDHELLNGKCQKCHRIMIDCECKAIPIHYPVKIKLIPHDGGPCPVEYNRYYIVLLRSNELVIIHSSWIYVNSWEWKRPEQYDNDIIAYCPIEFEEEMK